MDVIAVEEQTRLPLGRPWLSLAVDVPTRMVAGFHLSFDDPSVLAVALVLTHAVLPKEAWLSERQISLPWPVSGLPDWIETDNGEEFHSKAFERGAAEYGIRLTYRPRGAPQVGGHIERLIGTFMHRIHLIPGTTFSNVAEKGGYDSEGRAVMTLKELERWLALEILGVYHKSVHTALHQPPEQAWKERISTRPTPVRHPRSGRFLLDFLPAEERLIRRDGIRMFNLHYWDNVLSPLAGRSQQRFIIKYDPRDLSRVYLRDEKGDYWTIPYRDLGAPPITLWEHRNALRKLSAEGLQSVDEKLIFQTIAAQSELIAAARLRTRTARLAHARSNAAEPASPRGRHELRASRSSASFDTDDTSALRRRRLVMTPDLDHLQPPFRSIALQPAAERITWIQQDRWIHYTRADEALKRIAELLACPPRNRMPCLLLTGAPGMGKTHIVQKFVRDHPSEFDARDRRHPDPRGLPCKCRRSRWRRISMTSC